MSKPPLSFLECDAEEFGLTASRHLYSTDPEKSLTLRCGGASGSLQPGHRHRRLEVARQQREIVGVEPCAPLPDYLKRLGTSSGNASNGAGEGQGGGSTLRALSSVRLPTAYRYTCVFYWFFFLCRMQDKHLSSEKGNADCVW
jgi:hypothetical protein